MIPQDEQFISAIFDTESGDYPGANMHDWFDGSELLKQTGSFVKRLNTSFASRAEAWDWLVKSYKGPDIDGINVLIDGEAPTTAGNTNT